MSDEPISKEYARLFNQQLERHEKTLTDIGKECRRCREDLLERLGEIKTKQRELVVKIMIGAVILGLLANAGIGYLIK